MSALICPACQNSKLTWLNFDAEDFTLEDGIMECNGCHVQFTGIAGWQEAWDARRSFSIRENKVLLDVMYARAKQMGWLDEDTILQYENRNNG